VNTVAENPASDLEGIGDAQGDFQATIVELAELLAGMPEPLGDVACDGLREKHPHGHEVAAQDTPRALEVLRGVEGGGRIGRRPVPSHDLMRAFRFRLISSAVANWLRWERRER
jgi:hypothetical protein